MKQELSMLGKHGLDGNLLLLLPPNLTPGHMTLATDTEKTRLCTLSRADTMSQA